VVGGHRRLGLVLPGKVVHLRLKHRGDRPLVVAIDQPKAGAQPGAGQLFAALVLGHRRHRIALNQDRLERLRHLGAGHALDA
jgi:hypothetical protein